MTVQAPFAWKPDVVHLEAAGADAARGTRASKAKAWPAGEPEPDAWLLEKLDPIGHREEARPLLRRRLRHHVRQHPRLREQVRNAHVPAHRCFRTLRDHRGRGAIGVARVRRGRLADVGWVARSQHGVDHDRPADHLGREDRSQRPMGGAARFADLRQSGRRRRGCARRHQQRAGARPQAGGRPRRADGVPRVGRRVPLAGDPREALVRACQRLALPGRVLVAARREWRGLLHVEPRRGDGRGSRRVSRRQQRRAGHRTRSSPAKKMPTSSGAST